MDRILEPIIDNGKIERIWDKRYDTPVDVTDGTGRFGYLAYTLQSEDLNKLEHPGCVPFEEKYAGFDLQLENQEFGTKLTVESSGSGIVLDMVCHGQKADGVGLFLPFNFISRKNGDWQQQFTVSSPYHSADFKRQLFYLARPDGKGIVCVVENEIECFMVNYSPYHGGHFIRGITFWSQLDKAYGRGSREEKRVRVHILPVDSYVHAIQEACRIWDCCALYYDKAAQYIGQPMDLKMIGIPDRLHVVSPSGKEQILEHDCFVPQNYGFYRITPYKNGKAGLDCTVFAMDSLRQMHNRATKSIRPDHATILGHTDNGIAVYEPNYLSYRDYKDFNLCEHSMWVWSALKYLLREGMEQYVSADVENHLHIMDPKNQIGLYHCSYDPADHYNTVSDYRIQEAFNGVNILLDAYGFYGNKRYLELAKTVMQEKLAVDQLADGGIYRWAGQGDNRHREDYTTVTFMVLPVVDLALLLKREEDPQWEHFANCAIAMADHIIQRDLSFPTEGGECAEVDIEVEEGSISCAALTVLYVYEKLAKKPEYLEYATQVLNLHDAYSVYTPHPCMFRSSLRWWETIWEGDADGPAICFGHAWTIWRAEAEYWYGMIQKDDARLLDSYNGFMSNFSKTDAEGNMYAIYQYEQLSSPCLESSGWLTDRTNREGFPHKMDTTLSRYVYARADDTWFDTVAILPDHLLMAKAENGVIVPDFEDFKKLYIGNVTGEFYVQAKRPFEIVSAQNVTIEGTGIIKITISE